jgi:hypothetical protein
MKVERFLQMMAWTAAACFAVLVGLLAYFRLL